MIMSTEKKDYIKPEIKVHGNLVNLTQKRGPGADALNEFSKQGAFLINKNKYYFYEVFGLSIQSTFFFPELLNKSIGSDVKIYFNKFNNLENFEETYFGDLLKLRYNDHISLVFYDEKPIIKIINGNEIIIHPENKLPENLLRTLILSKGMGSILQQRGLLVLHASSVKMGDGAIVFAGFSGNGKSTITSVLNKNGYPLISDDLLAIKSEGTHFLAYSGFPRIKLWKDIIEDIMDNQEFAHIIHPESNKFSYSVEENFFQQALNIKKIFLIENGEKNEIIKVNSQKALISLIKNSYNFNIFNSSEKISNLIQCAALVENF